MNRPADGPIVSDHAVVFARGGGVVDAPVSPTGQGEVQQMADTAIIGTRRNHALEHATVALLLEKGIKPPMGGYSVPSGFLIWSRAPAHDVSTVASEALDLLRDGHHDLAISPYCGTNIAAGVFIGGLTASLLKKRAHGILPKLAAAAAAIAVASMLSRPIGELIQRRFTTLADARGMQIVSSRQLIDWPVNVVWLRTRFRDS